MTKVSAPPLPVRVLNPRPTVNQVIPGAAFQPVASTPTGQDKVFNGGKDEVVGSQVIPACVRVAKFDPASGCG